MTDGGGDPGFHVRLTDQAYAGWRRVADDQGMTTSGLLEMVGRHLAADRTLDVGEALRHATLVHTP